MKGLIAILSLLATGGLVLGAGCAPNTVSSQADANPTVGRDSVVIPGASAIPLNLIGDADITLALGRPAEFATLSVAEVSLLQATSPDQLEAAERAVNSGAYLGDPLRVVQIAGDEHPGVIEFDAGTEIGKGFETEFVFRFQEGGGDVAFEIAGEPSQAGRRMPSMFRLEVAMRRNEGLHIVLVVGDEGAQPSEVGRVDIGAGSPDEFAHRVRLRYEPGSINIVFDGNATLNAPARLGGTNATASILVHPAESAYILSWTFGTLP